MKKKVPRTVGNQVTGEGKKEVLVQSSPVKTTYKKILPTHDACAFFISQSQLNFSFSFYICTMYDFTNGN